MVRVSNLSLPLHHTEHDLVIAVAMELGVSARDIAKFSIAKKSLDARTHGDARFVYAVDVLLAGHVVLNEAILKKPTITPSPDTDYHYASVQPKQNALRPVVIGAGPCGLFGALLLAKSGLRPLLLERGTPVEERIRDVNEFWQLGLLKHNSNALFGEGGAGTFSDGKLTTQIKDRFNRKHWILRQLVAAGAPEEIVYVNKPHIGTDRLVSVVKNIRKSIEAEGGEVRFRSQMTRIIRSHGTLKAVIINDNEEIAVSYVLLAPGHSARDTFTMLLESGVAITAKAFSIGVRIEHPQQLINQALYGVPELPGAGPADYKLVHHCANKRSVYTFCMCPGGVVIGVGHEPNTIVTNGMSCYARNGTNANSGLLVGVTPEDFGSSHPLAGMYFQRQWEELAFRSGGGGYKAPVQCIRDLLAGRPSQTLGDVSPSYLPGVTPTDLRECLPHYVIEAYCEALPALAKKLKEFDLPDAVLTGVETRSSSPIRIERDPFGESISCKGLFPAGEGAGYAGGIISSAIDGMRAAEEIARRLAK